MNEKQTVASEPTRPTKKQKELLAFIERFIVEHGYSPSYREIMSGLGYTSVATVALHINNLIRRGHLRKRDRSARSLEVVQSTATQDIAKISTNQVLPSEEKWLVEKVEHAFVQLETTGGELPAASLDQLAILLSALRVLGMEGAAQSFVLRLSALKGRQAAS